MKEKKLSVVDYSNENPVDYADKNHWLAIPETKDNTDGRNAIKTVDELLRGWSEMAYEPSVVI